MTMYPTTTGNGPFRPAIKFNGITYVLDELFAIEDNAFDIANEIAEAINHKVFDVITANNFEAMF